jgi:hypothetical protein
MQPLEGPLQASATAPTPPRPRALAPSLSTRVSRRYDQSQYRLLLGGMLRQGHGIEALCLFLTLTRDALFDLVIQLGLPTPHERALRRSGGVRAWGQEDFEILLDGWLNNWSAACIGDRLGRSRGSIWYQARRLGLPKRERRLLHWPERTAPEPVVAPEASSARQRLPPRWFVKGTDNVLELTSKRNGLEVDWAANIEAYVDIAWRAFSGQRTIRIAEAYGVSQRTITSQIWWLHAIGPRNHKDLVDGFDRARGMANAEAAGFELRKCQVNCVFPYFFHKTERRARRDKRNAKCNGIDF